MASKRFTLLGMARSGEACLIRDADDRVWVSSIYAPVQEVAAGDVDQIVAEHDWEHVNRRFDTWDQLDEYRSQHASAPPSRFPEFAEYDADEVREALEETQTAHSPDQRLDAQLLLIDILEHCPVVRQDGDLYTAVISRLAEL